MCIKGYGYLVVKAALPSPFSAKKWPHDRKAERKTVSDFVPTGRLIKNKNVIIDYNIQRRLSET